MRAHWCAVVRGRLAFVAAGPDVMTAARFDVMSRIRERMERARATGDEIPENALTQAELRADLQVSGTTVSRMIKRLVELGVVRRRRGWGDKRTYVLWLTSLGVALVRRARFLLERERAVTCVYHDAASRTLNGDDRSEWEDGLGDRFRPARRARRLAWIRNMTARVARILESFMLAPDYDACPWEH